MTKAECDLIEFQKIRVRVASILKGAGFLVLAAYVTVIVSFFVYAHSVEVETSLESLGPIEEFIVAWPAFLFFFVILGGGFGFMFAEEDKDTKRYYREIEHYCQFGGTSLFFKTLRNYLSCWLLGFVMVAMMISVPLTIFVGGAYAAIGLAVLAIVVGIPALFVYSALFAVYKLLDFTNRYHYVGSLTIAVATAVAAHQFLFDELASDIVAVAASFGIGVAFGSISYVSVLGVHHIAEWSREIKRNYGTPKYMLKTAVEMAVGKIAGPADKYFFEPLRKLNPWPEEADSSIEPGWKKYLQGGPMPGYA